MYYDVGLEPEITIDRLIDWANPSYLQSRLRTVCAVITGHFNECSGCRFRSFKILGLTFNPSNNLRDSIGGVTQRLGKI